MLKHEGGLEMSFFAVQVKSGQEIEAKEMLKAVFSKLKSIEVKAIYALESFTHVVQQGKAADKLSECLDDNDILEYLQAKRVRENLRNLRTAYAEMPEGHGEMTMMQESYEQEMKEQTKSLKENKPSKRLSVVLKGYILLELTEDVFELPRTIWQAVMSVSKVSSILSPYCIPEEEVEQFFETIDLTPSVEINVDQDNSDDVISDEKRDECVHSVQQSPIAHWMEKCRLFISRKKKKVSIPLPLFHYFLENKAEMVDETELPSFIQRIMRSVRLEVSG